MQTIPKLVNFNIFNSEQMANILQDTFLMRSFNF